MTMLCCPGDEALSFRSRDLYEPWNPRATMAEHIPARAGEPTERPRFENMALLAGKMPPRAGDLLGILLASTFPVCDRGCEVLRPLWAEEAMHRAYGLVRLVDARNRRAEATSENPIAVRMEAAIARDLAARFRELATGGEREMLPCAAALRDVMTGLGALFGYPAKVLLKTQIEEVSVPGYKRRALVLATAELVGNALLHAFRIREAGLIEVGLTLRGAKSACLRVADNGIGFSDSPPNLACGVAAALAGLLEADLRYDRMAGWTIAEIAFPVF